MIISLSDYAYVGKDVELNEDYSMNTVSISGDEYEILEKTPVSIHIVCDEKDKIKLSVKLKLLVNSSCDRCLEDVSVDLDIDFFDEYEVSENTVDTDEIISEEIMLDWPMKVLCSDDCKGLCLKCGLNLNKDQCDCDTFIPDPRMAAIKDIFESER